MKKNNSYGKRALALALAAVMLMGDASSVSAARNTDISKAADGSVSKVIGLRESGITGDLDGIGSELFLTNAKGEKFPFYYTNYNTSNTEVKVAGNALWTRSAENHLVFSGVRSEGCYVYKGVKYADADYSKTDDVTTFKNPVGKLIACVQADGSGQEELNQHRDEATGLYALDGRLYNGKYSVYYTLYSLDSDRHMYADGNYVYKIENGEKVDLKDPATGLYLYEGKYYATAQYVENKYNSSTYSYYNYSRFYNEVAFVDSEEELKVDTDGDGIKDSYAYGKTGRADDGRYYYYMGSQLVYSNDLSKLVTEENNSYSVKKESNGFYKLGDNYFASAKILNKDGVPALIQYYTPVKLWYNTYSDYTDKSGNYDKRYNNESGYGVYKVGDTYATYYVKNNRIYYADAVLSYAFIGAYDTEEERQAAIDSYAKNADGTEYVKGKDYQPTYYEVNGVAYKELTTGKKLNGKYYLLGSSDKEITLGNKMLPTFSWYDVNVGDKKLSADGKKLFVGYEIMVNDEIITNTNSAQIASTLYVMNSDAGTRMITKGSSVNVNKLMANGDSVKVQVRAVNYVQNKKTFEENYYEHEYKQSSYTVVKTGEWSEPCVYTRGSTTAIGKINDLSAKVEGTAVKLTWTPMPDAKSATVYQIDSTVALDLTTDNVQQYLDGTSNSKYYTVNSYSINPSEASEEKNIYEYNDSYFDLDARKTVKGYNYAIYGYHYYVATITGTEFGYYAETSYSNIVGLNYSLQPSIPTVENLRVEYNMSGGYDIVWDKKDINANVVVYAYEKSELPKYFNASELNALSKVITSYEARDVRGSKVELTEEVMDKLVDGSYAYICGDKSQSTFYSKPAYGGVSNYEYADAYLKGDKFYTDSACTKEIDKKYVFVLPGDYELTDGSTVKIDWSSINGKNYVVDSTKYGTVETLKNTKNAVLMTSSLNSYKPEEYNVAKKVFKAQANLITGKIENNSFRNGFYESLKPGRTYYFVAYTYDSLNYDNEKPAIDTIDGRDFVFYNDFSAASNMVSAKDESTYVSLYTKVTKKSIKLTLGSSVATGYIIYKKVGNGKYKKLTTTTDNQYIDKKVKLGKEYTYKAVPYIYNEKTGECTVCKNYAVATTSPSSYSTFTLEAQMKSKSSVKLSWTKLPKAKKYEIYRYKADTDVKTDFDNHNLPGTRYKLIKTIKKSKKTTYVDKVPEGAVYSYMVVAYYKDKKVMCKISASDSVAMYLKTPTVEHTQTGNTVKLTWEPDKFAAGYEVAYTYYDGNGYALSNLENTAKTKKNSYVIKNVPEGGYVAYQVRAYTKSGKYSSYSAMVFTKGSLDVAKNVKAVYDPAANAVKITWSPVKGAKYYRVLRSTVTAKYDQKSKKYYAVGADISAQSNKGQANDSVCYIEYYDATGSIVGTSAYDYYNCMDDVKYYYCVVAYSDQDYCYSLINNGNQVNMASSKPASVIFNPTKISVNKISRVKKGAKITYSKVAGAKKIILLRSNKKNGKYKVVANAKGNSTSVIDKSAKKGKTYFYKLRVIKTNGLMADSTITSPVKKAKIK